MAKNRATLPSIQINANRSAEIICGLFEDFRPFYDRIRPLRYFRKAAPYEGSGNCGLSYQNELT
jgi:hypothetical protein